MTSRVRSVGAALAALVAALALLPPGGSATHGENHAPVVTIHDDEHWYVHALMGHGSLAVTACDEDGFIEAILVEVWPDVVSYSWFPSWESCETSNVEPFNPTPGTFLVRAFAWDEEGAEGSAMGTLHYSVIPADLSSVKGFPRLDDLPECGVGLSHALELIVGADGSVDGYRVASDGQVCADTLAEAPIRGGDRFVLIEWNRGVGEAVVRVDGIERWSSIVREDGAWWRIVPVTDPLLPQYDIDPVEHAHGLADFLLP